MRFSLFIFLVLYSFSVFADYLDYKKAKVIAIQNKAYTMRHLLELTPAYLPFDNYTKGLGIGFGYTYHFTDTISWEVVQASLLTPMETGLRSELIKEHDADTTDFKEVKTIAGTALKYSPLYYKSVLFNSLILHGHWFTTLGFAALKVNDSWKLGNQVGLGFNIMTSHSVVLSFTLKDYIYWSESSVYQVFALLFGFGVNFGRS